MNEQEDLSTDDEDVEDLEMPPLPFKFLIIDCSPINFIDTTGVKAIKQVGYRNFLKVVLMVTNFNYYFLKKVLTDFNEIGIKVYLADCNGELTI